MNKISSRTNLICFPYAGGSKYSYNSLNAFAPTEINVVPIELPGHGERVMEPLLVDINSMVDELFDQLKEHINKPYIMYGHSMGGILSFLVANKLVHRNLPIPRHLIITGCEGPSVKNERKKKISKLPNCEFVEELKIFGGIPDEIFDNEGFFEFFEPILRADFTAIEGYEYCKYPPLPIPICVMYGSEEDITFEEASSWKEESNREVEIIEFSGNHFFIFKHEKEIMNIIGRKAGQQTSSV